MSARPSNFDAELFERYGHSPTPDHLYNPYPVIDAASGIDERPLLSKTFGGSGRLPLGFGQGRKADGAYSGILSLNCFSCHAGQIGSGEIADRDGNGNAVSYGANAYGSFMGLPNTNTELGVLLIDLIHAGTWPNSPPFRRLVTCPWSTPRAGPMPPTPRSRPSWGSAISTR